MIAKMAWRWREEQVKELEQKVANLHACEADSESGCASFVGSN
jgi:hypothetical protein